MYIVVAGILVLPWILPNGGDCSSLPSERWDEHVSSGTFQCLSTWIGVRRRYFQTLLRSFIKKLSLVIPCFSKNLRNFYGEFGVYGQMEVWSSCKMQERALSIVIYVRHLFYYERNEDEIIISTGVPTWEVQPFYTPCFS